ncbi:putative toxin-antitoxin system toxin component, PIN family [Sutterella sp.]|uniref:PIN domain-containing protein n=1 Tax=Sutterella sp. TaxID=1981025 RepID=UPI0026DFE100|nr:PIN domain-containing protein [Sutterella sp.]MDO5531345.1 PIN domain-containing protein [Sutterella sp.]
MFPAEIHSAVRAMTDRLARESSDAGHAEALSVVLDTHIVMECFHWRDPAAGALREAIEAGRVRPVVSEETMLELAGVLSRPAFGLGNDEVIAILGTFAALARLVSREALEAAASGLSVRCRDPEDQKFLTLAAAAGARLLVTRDRLLRKAAKRLRPMGVVTITTDEFERTLAETRKE